MDGAASPPDIRSGAEYKPLRDVMAELDSWEQRVAALWAEAADGDGATVLAMDALASERPAGDPVAIYERASVRDFVGLEAEAETLYRQALAGGLADVDERRAVEARVQLASTLRLLGRPQEAVAVLEELDLSSLPLDRADWVRAFLALALADAGNPKAAARIALEGFSNHLTQYGAVVARYAADLSQDP
jgi:tetratricopeptide (TPR) repeat protein